MDFYTSMTKEEISQIASDELLISKEVNSNLRALLDSIKDRILISDKTLLSIIAAINAGYNVILYGPPGTAKSTLSEILPKVLWNAKCNIHTADSDWSVKKVIGGLTIAYEINGNSVKEQITPKDGYLVEDIFDCYKAAKCHEQYDTVFSVIDEFNRTNMDECLGPMFTAMGSDNKVIKLDYNKNFGNKPLEITIPKKYRIICNMNKYDRTFTNDLSEALTRRFKWIFVGTPSAEEFQIEKELIKKRVFENQRPSDIPSNDQLEKIIEYKNNSFFDTNISEKIFSILQTIREDFEIGTAYGIDALKLAYNFFFLKIKLIDFSNTDITIEKLLEEPDYQRLIESIQDETLKVKVTNEILNLIKDTIDAALTMTIAPLFDAIEDLDTIDKIKNLLSDYPQCLNELSRVNLIV